MNFKNNLKQAYHPIDLPNFEGDYQRYSTLRETVNQIAPKTILEIGVRAGYSSFTFFSCPTVERVIAIDANQSEHHYNTHCGLQGLYKHALEINKGKDYQLWLVDSHRISKLPSVDLIFIDGDHTTEGCYLDLCLAAEATNTIILDDYNTNFGGIYLVREAIDLFCTRHALSGTLIDNGSTGLYQINLPKR